MDDELIELPSVVPLFPLPGVVLFPNTILPLHVFEPRYRTMMEDTLEAARVLGVALLKPGFEPHYHTPRAPVHGIIGVGQVVEHEQLDDGNYNLLLRGLSRAVILDEDCKRPYRRARVEPLDTYYSRDEAGVGALRSELLETIRDSRGLQDKLREQWMKLCEAPLELNELTDLLAAGVPAEPEFRQCLLGEPDAVTRTEMVLGQVRTLAAMADNHRRTTRNSDHNWN